VNDGIYLKQALEQAHNAWAVGEVPVGAVIVHEGRVLATGFNQPISSNDPTAHAEIVAMRAAAEALGNYRLTGCTLYVTLEPCAMCAAALIHARFARVVFGAPDPKTGACGGNIDITGSSFNHQTRFEGGLLAAECGEVLKRFFAERRHKSASQAQLPAVDLSGAEYIEAGIPSEGTDTGEQR
jgi:tRNA(adenine34) deaminase